MMLEFLPRCPRLHGGCVLDVESVNTGLLEWVCRICGTRLYGKSAVEAAEAQVAEVDPVPEDMGRPRKTPRFRSKHGALSRSAPRGHRWQG